MSEKLRGETNKKIDRIHMQSKKTGGSDEEIEKQPAVSFDREAVIVD